MINICSIVLYIYETLIVLEVDTCNYFCEQRWRRLTGCMFYLLGCDVEYLLWSCICNIIQLYVWKLWYYWCTSFEYKFSVMFITSFFMFNFSVFIFKLVNSWFCYGFNIFITFLTIAVLQFLISPLTLYLIALSNSVY